MALIPGIGLQVRPNPLLKIPKTYDKISVYGLEELSSAWLQRHYNVSTIEELMDMQGISAWANYVDALIRDIENR